MFTSIGIVLLAVPFFAFVVGYYNGRNQVDPNTSEGAAYYYRRK